MSPSFSHIQKKMGSVLVVLVELSLLCFTVYSEQLDLVTETVPPIPHHGGIHHYPTMAPSPSPTSHYHPHAPTPSPLHHAPSHSPVHPPSHHHHHHAHSPSNAPILPPAHAPSPLPPFHFPRSFVAVQGVVYRKSCKFVGGDTLSEATPVSGAIVKLQCNSSKDPQEVKKVTDNNGYFYVEAPHTVTNYGAHKCKVSLVSAPPMANCDKPSDLHGGVKGAILRAEKSIVVNKLPFVVYSVGPLAFEPKCSHIAPAPAPHHF